MTIVAPQPPIETTTQSPLGEAVPPMRHRFSPSPLNKRRWQNFKANRRGYWSFWIFLILFFVSLFANFIANDRPLAVKYNGHLYWPVLFNYAETTFGGDFETAYGGQSVNGIFGLMKSQCAADYFYFACDAGVVESGAAAGSFRWVESGEGAEESGGGSGVADSHFTCAQNFGMRGVGEAGI